MSLLALPEPLSALFAPGFLLFPNAFFPGMALHFSMPMALARFAPLVLSALTSAAALALAVRQAFRRHARQEQDRQTQLQNLFDHLTEGIVVSDLNGRIVQMNQAAIRIFGFDERVGNLKQLFERMTATDANGEPITPDQQPLILALRGSYLQNFEIVLRNRATELVTVFSVNTAAIHNRAGKRVRVLASYRDISERKQEEQARHQLEAQLRQSQKMQAIGQLTGGLAHDFNNLLGIVLGNLDLLEHQLAGRESYLARIRPAQQAAIRGAELTRRLLFLSSRQDLSPVPAALEEVIESTLALARSALGPGIEVEVSIEQKLPPVFVDVPGLESALLNLAVNARDAMPQGGQLTLSASICPLDTESPVVGTGEIEAGPYACITVADTGSGMAPNVLERAFEPFFTTKPQGKGTGLGLAMVYGFVRNSGGTVQIESEPGMGTAVSLYLPLGGAPAELARASAPQEPSARFRGRVLLVDDEIALLEIAGTFLESMGFTVLQAEDAPRALRLARQDAGLGLLVTDVLMPGPMNGIELAHELRELYPQLKVLYTSGLTPEALAERSGTELDAPLLQKPYQRAELTALVRKTMQPVPEGESL